MVALCRNLSSLLFFLDKLILSHVRGLRRRLAMPAGYHLGTTSGAEGKMSSPKAPLLEDNLLCS